MRLNRAPIDSLSPILTTKQELLSHELLSVLCEAFMQGFMRKHDGAMIPHLSSFVEAQAMDF